MIPDIGDYVKFINENGYESQRAVAAKALWADRTYAVVRREVGQSHSYLWLRGESLAFNSVMFRRVDAAGNFVSEDGAASPPQRYMGQDVPMRSRRGR